ncbi:ComEC/Rec2 family competence protein [Verrucomicrobiota bacterium]
MSKLIQKEDLVIHFLDVGLGDAIVIEFPEDDHGKRLWGIVDFYNAKKSMNYLDRLNTVRPRSEIAFVCATHPHSDHISGIASLMADPDTRPAEFWDSGFRHNSMTYRRILGEVSKHKIKMRRVSSGMEWYYGNVRVTALSPSVTLRNRYATYGVDMNNASIVLRIENCNEDAVITQSLRYVGNVDPDITRKAGAAVAILGGDAEFDSWARISQEYPFIERTSKHHPQVKKMVNLLSCWLVKVAHHGSMHSAPLEVYERMMPKVAVVSAEQDISSTVVAGQTLERGLYPHPVTGLSLREVGADVVTTEGTYEEELKQHADPTYVPKPERGNIIAVIPPGGGNARYAKVGVQGNGDPVIPEEI